MSIVTPALLARILNDYALPVSGAHGPAHWARVLENGRRLAAVTGADPGILELFAVFHDSRRVTEAVDHGHGRRGAELMRGLRGELFAIDDQRFALVEYACEEHTSDLTAADVNVQTCWDADRLDLLRVGIRPDPRRLCTAAARDPGLLEWANARARERQAPAAILTEWGFDPHRSG